MKFDLHRELPEELIFRDLILTESVWLQGWTDHTCDYFGRQVSLKTKGCIPPQDAADELRFTGYMMVCKFKHSEDKFAAVLSYIKMGIDSAATAMLREYYDRAKIDQQLSERGFTFQELPDTPEEAMVRREREEEAKMRSDALIRVIKGAADILGVKTDPENWVDTAISVIREGIHKKRLQGDMFEKIEAVRQNLESNGYKTELRQRSASLSSRGWIVRLLEEDPNMESCKIVEKLRQEGITKDAHRIYADISKIKKRMNIKPPRQRSKLKIAMKEILDAGASDLGSMTDGLKSRGVLYRPSTMREYFRRMQRGAAL